MRVTKMLLIAIIDYIIRSSIDINITVENTPLVVEILIELIRRRLLEAGNKLVIKKIIW